MNVVFLILAVLAVVLSAIRTWISWNDYVRKWHGWRPR